MNTYNVTLNLLSIIMDHITKDQAPSDLSESQTIPQEEQPTPKSPSYKYTLMGVVAILAIAGVAITATQVQNFQDFRQRATGAQMLGANQDPIATPSAAISPEITPLDTPIPTATPTPTVTLTPTPTLSPTPTELSCLGKTVSEWKALGYIVKLGTSGNDSIVGTAGKDVLIGLGGADIISGGNGNDVICGGDGNDTLRGYDGDDQIDAGAGDDFVDGLAGNDIITGGDGNDKLVGGNGDDVVYGGAGIDKIEDGSGKNILSGGDGNDTITGGIHEDLIYGGAGDDFLYGKSAVDLMDGGPGKDLVNGDDGNDYVVGGEGDDKLNGGSGTDNVIGDCFLLDNVFLNGQARMLAQAEAILGPIHSTSCSLSGNDVIHGDSNPDILIGDTATLAQEGVSVNPPQHSADFICGTCVDDPNDQTVKIDKLTYTLSGNGNDQIYGDNGGGGEVINYPERLYGNGGDDILDGGDGDEYIYGSEGNDKIYGRPGTDYIYGGPGTDFCDGGTNNPGIWSDFSRDCETNVNIP